MQKDNTESKERAMWKEELFCTSLPAEGAYKQESVTLLVSIPHCSFQEKVGLPEPNILKSPGIYQVLKHNPLDSIKFYPTPCFEKKKKLHSTYE